MTHRVVRRIVLLTLAAAATLGLGRTVTPQGGFGGLVVHDEGRASREAIAALGLDAEARRGAAETLMAGATTEEPGRVPTGVDRALLEAIRSEEDPEVLHMLLRAAASRKIPALCQLELAAAAAAMGTPTTEVAALLRQALAHPERGWPIDSIADDLAMRLGTASGALETRDDRELLLLAVSVAGRISASAIERLEAALRARGPHARTAAVLAAFGAPLDRVALEEASRATDPILGHWACLGLLRATERDGVAPARWADWIRGADVDLAMAALRTASVMRPLPPEVVRAIVEVASARLASPSARRTAEESDPFAALATRVVSQLGAAARPALPRLVEVLDECDGATVTQVARLLAGMGPTATDAIPALLAAARRTVQENREPVGARELAPAEIASRTQAGNVEPAVAAALLAIDPRTGARAVMETIATQPLDGAQIQLLGHLLPPLGPQLVGDVATFMSWLERDDTELQPVALETLVGMGPFVQAVRDDLLELVTTGSIRDVGLAFAALCQVRHDDVEGVVRELERHWPEGTGNYDFGTLFERISGIDRAALPLLRAATRSEHRGLATAARTLMLHLRDPDDLLRAEWVSALTHRNGRTGRAATMVRVWENGVREPGFSADELEEICRHTNSEVRAMLVGLRLRSLGVALPSSISPHPLRHWISHLAKSPEAALRFLSSVRTRVDLLSHYLAEPLPVRPADATDWLPPFEAEATVRIQALAFARDESPWRRRAAWLTLLAGGATLAEIADVVAAGVGDRDQLVRAAAAAALRQADR